MHILWPMLAALAWCGPALAEAPSTNPPAPSAPAPSLQEGRFSMTPTQGGFLRLDKETGAVSFCTVDAGLSACRVSADERAAFESEIARLRRDNADSKPPAAPASPARPRACPRRRTWSGC